MSEGKKEILLGDCLELMKDIPNGSIDMILCDLPYGTTQNKWDCILPLNELWQQYERIIKENGAIVLTASQPFTTTLIASNLKLFRYDIVWHKRTPSGVLNANKMPIRTHETILVFYKKPPTYNPIKTIGNKICGIKKHKVNSTNYRNTDRETDYADDGTRFPTSVLDITGIVNNSKEKVGHPTQKPIKLFDWLIRTYTNENDLVLDNTAGSGTTAIACLNTNRQFIVMEKEQKYYDIILKRVGDFNKKFEQQTLFGNEM